MLHTLMIDSDFCKEKQKQKILAYFLLHYYGKKLLICMETKYHFIIIKFKKFLNFFIIYIIC